MFPIDYNTLKYEQAERIERAQLLARARPVKRRPRPVRRFRWQLWRRPAPIVVPRIRLASDAR